MNTQSSTIVQRLWNYCNVLRDERRLESARAGECEGQVEGLFQSMLSEAFA